MRFSRRHPVRPAFICLLPICIFALSACGGGGGSSSSPTGNGNNSVAASSAPASSSSSSLASAPTALQAPQPDLTADPTLPAKGSADYTKAAEAVRFLTQATFGPTAKDIDHLMKVGKEAWLNEQFVEPRNVHLDLLLKRYEQIGLVPVPEKDITEEAWQRDLQRSDIFWEVAIWGKDQLRQRVAYSLSQIWVISNTSDVLFNDSRGIANYNDILAKNAFGNYRTLMKELTLNPMMGEYLSMVRNEKANAERNIRPDENFAREIMQLFTIGLVELNNDGSVKLDSKGKPIPTYDQDTIKALARVFTGWNMATINQWWEWTDSGASEVMPMKSFTEYHDTGEKVLFGKTIPANQTPEQDIDSALDILFAHANVGPFISKQLIQRLVTSNPSPAYVQRVSNVFNNNGRGAKGDLAAVVKAILLDDEASKGADNDPEKFGKMREPMLQFASVWRAFHGQGSPLKNSAGFVSPPRLRFYGAGRELGQRPFGSNSVFNFYRPDYQFPGEIKNANLFAPEFQLLTESNANAKLNLMIWTHFYTDVNDAWAKDPGDADWDILPVRMDFTREKALAADREKLLDHLNLLLMANQMSPGMRQVMSNYLASLPNSNDWEKEVMVYEALYMLAASPEFAVQR